jgi:hypothetical protein
MGGASEEAMLIIVLIVIITVVLLLGMDQVSGSRQTTDGRHRKAADARFLYRFLHRRSQRHPQPKP